MVLFGIPTVYDDERKKELPIIEYIKEGDYLEEKRKRQEKKKVLTDLPDSLVEAVKILFVSLLRYLAPVVKKEGPQLNAYQYIPIHQKQDSIYHLVTDGIKYL